jgi:hypothetical protein
MMALRSPSLPLPPSLFSPPPPSLPSCSRSTSPTSLSVESKFTVSPPPPSCTSFHLDPDHTSLSGVPSFHSPRCSHLQRCHSFQVLISFPLLPLLLLMSRPLAASERAMTIMREQVNSQLSSSEICKVQEAVQKTLEDELMPLIQSEVNAEMRDLQMDSQLFMAPTGPPPPPCPRSSPSVLRKLVNLTKSWRRGAEGTSSPLPTPVPLTFPPQADISEAAKRCSSVIQPLFSHWAELPQHRDQVLTILDRVIRGYASTARSLPPSL